MSDDPKHSERITDLQAVMKAMQEALAEDGPQETNHVILLQPGNAGAVVFGSNLQPLSAAHMLRIAAENIERRFAQGAYRRPGGGSLPGRGLN